MLVGLVAGALSGLFGVGGGILIVPGLVLWARMEQRRAHGTSLAAIVPIATGGVIGYAVEGSVDWPAAGLLAAGSAAGAVAGTHWLNVVSERALRRGFAAFLVLGAIGLLLHVSAQVDRAPLSIVLAGALVAVGIISGVLAGLLGVGGGIVMVPAMVFLLSVPDAVAKGTSLVVIIPTAVVGTIRNARAGNADLRLAAITGAAGVAAAFAASLLAVRLDPGVSAALFAALLAIVAARMVLADGYRSTHPW